MNIFLSKKGHIPKAIGYFGQSPIEMFPAFPDITPIETEYWECAECMKK